MSVLLAEQWPVLKFTVPAMSVDVYTKSKITGKKVKKIDERGHQVTDERIIPKERPRFSFKNKHPHAYTATNTENFEKWIRRKFFEAYPGNCGVYNHKKPTPVHSTWIGCRMFGENQPCARYRQGQDFLDCQVCNCRRKNLCMFLDIYIKDERHLDQDNTEKIVLDALNKVCFFDDSQFVAKDVNLFCYAKQERLEVTIMVKPTQFLAGSLVGGYSIKNMPIKDAEAYVHAVAETVDPKEIESFKSYLLRCDDRKYMVALTNSLGLKG